MCLLMQPVLIVHISHSKPIMYGKKVGDRSLGLEKFVVRLFVRLRNIK